MVKTDFLKNSDKIEDKNVFSSSDKVKIGKSIYIIKRHFSGKRDLREAIYAAIKNEAFRTSEETGK